MSARKVGGIWFIRVQRFQFSYCRVNRKPRTIHVAGMSYTVMI